MNRGLQVPEFIIVSLGVGFLGTIAVALVEIAIALNVIAGIK